jgi:hypothetical protein
MVLWGFVTAALGRHVEFPAPDLPRLPGPFDGKVSDGPAPAARPVRQQWALGSGPLGDLVALGSLTFRAAGFPAAAAGLNIPVAGSTQTGNPTSC